MLMDDLPWNSGGFGEYGGDSDMHFVTPNLNDYASSGVILKNYYTQETCTPSRASLLTGRYPLSIGMQYGSVETNLAWGLRMDETLFPEVLKANSEYTTYMVGKWNIGHFTPRMLPTSRGFDYSLSYQSSTITYWSKFELDDKMFASNDDDSGEKHFQDLIYGDNTCYAKYDGDDKHDHSTFLFRDKALNVIKKHDYDSTSLFLYLAFQAVHDPFEDIDYPNGLPTSYFTNSMHKKVIKKVAGRRRRQLALNLNLVDSAVKSIVDAVDDVGQSSNTYFILTSDNGGCYKTGGANGPLRGNKGTLFEGGTKVSAIMWGKNVPEGVTYGGVFHVSDWFPTMLEMADITYEPDSSYALDGVSHWSSIKTLTSSSSSGSADGPRTYMLYNYYTNITDKTFDEPIRAIRNRKFKLIQTKADNNYDGTFDADEKQVDDDNLAEQGTCTQGTAVSSGTYTSYLFNLESDPYETTNLYYETKYASVVSELTTKLDAYANAAAEDTEYTVAGTKACFVAWKKAGNTVVPWTIDDGSTGLPSFKKHGCDYSLVSPLYRDDDDNDDDDDFKYVDDDDFDDAKPTRQPTHKPTSKPTHKPTSK